MLGSRGELLAQAAEGDRRAARKLVDEVGPTVFGYVIGRVGDRSVADDIVQEVFLEALKSRHTYRGESALTTWMCAIARSRIHRWYEGQRRRERIEAAARDGARMAAGPPDSGEAIEQRDAVVRALAQLPPSQRQAVFLKYLDGMSVAAIAEVMALGPIQVQSLLQRGRASLRELMKEALA